jgi:hypothetical protein
MCPGPGPGPAGRAGGRQTGTIRICCERKGRGFPLTTPRLISPGRPRPHPIHCSMQSDAAQPWLACDDPCVPVCARRDRERFHGQNGRDSSAAGEAGQGQDRDGDGRQQSVTHHHPQEHKAIRPGTIRSRRSDPIRPSYDEPGRIL